MTETLRVLVDQDIDDEDLRAAAHAAYAELEDRGIDVEGVAPVLRERVEEGPDA